MIKQLKEFLSIKVTKDNLLPVGIAGIAIALVAVLVIDIIVKLACRTVM